MGGVSQLPLDGEIQVALVAKVGKRWGIDGGAGNNCDGGVTFEAVHVPLLPERR